MKKDEEFEKKTFWKTLKSYLVLGLVFFALLTPNLALAYTFEDQYFGFEDWQPGVFPIDQTFSLENGETIDNAQTGVFALEDPGFSTPIESAQSDIFPLSDSSVGREEIIQGAQTDVSPIGGDVIPARQVDVFPLAPSPPPVFVTPPPVIVRPTPIIIAQPPTIVITPPPPIVVSPPSIVVPTALVAQPISAPAVICPQGFIQTVSGSNIVCVQQVQQQTQVATAQANASTGPINVSVERTPAQVVVPVAAPAVQQVPVQQAPTAISVKAPVVTQPELPRTGLPLALWTFSALAPLGFKLKGIGSIPKGEGSLGRYIWQEREFLRN